MTFSKGILISRFKIGDMGDFFNNSKPHKTMEVYYKRDLKPYSG
jgi:hypothetical protein